MKFLGKTELMMISKVPKKKALHSLHTVYFLKYILRVKTWIFLNETSILVLSELAIFYSILNKNKLRKNC